MYSSEFPKRAPKYANIFQGKACYGKSSKVYFYIIKAALASLIRVICKVWVLVSTHFPTRAPK